MGARAVKPWDTWDIITQAASQKVPPQRQLEGSLKLYVPEAYSGDIPNRGNTHDILNAIKEALKEERTVGVLATGSRPCPDGWVIHNVTNIDDDIRVISGRLVSVRAPQQTTVADDDHCNSSFAMCSEVSGTVRPLLRATPHFTEGGN